MIEPSCEDERIFRSIAEAAGGPFALAIAGQITREFCVNQPCKVLHRTANWATDAPATG